ncbi:hypothetical protein COCON_G00113010 [Conger conger]|uniref:Uncharacterized protein n=1 Tax=Conger conger TaxID=82655 RepID=A0A9Q1I0E6_CONCO|nr:hypothetical protein COCON_G00113010 [Conger conger]
MFYYILTDLMDKIAETGLHRLSIVKEVLKSHQSHKPRDIFSGQFSITMVAGYTV